MKTTEGLWKDKCCDAYVALIDDDFYTPNQHQEKILDLLNKMEKTSQMVGHDVMETFV